MRIIAVVQARTGSTRLPGKILLPLCGKTLLERMLERVQAALELDGIVVATTTAPEDDPVRNLFPSANFTAALREPHVTR